jgi:hypothetical protein
MYTPPEDARAVRISADGVTLDGDLLVPAGATGIVVFAHGSGSSRFSTRNRMVAQLSMTQAWRRCSSIC